MEKFNDRKDAGQLLAEHLKTYEKDKDAIILALPRGGVPVAYEVADALSLPLDVFLVRKLGVPGHEELAMGAIASGDTVIFNDEIIRMLSLSDAAIQEVIKSETEELKRRESAYRGDRPFPELKDKRIILVDDGIATGATIRAAIKGIYLRRPKEVIVAVPVAALSSYEEISSLVDKMVCPLKPINFYAVGLWYEIFGQTSDEEVIELLEKAKENQEAS